MGLALPGGARGSVWPWTLEWFLFGCNMASASPTSETVSEAPTRRPVATVGLAARSTLARQTRRPVCSLQGSLLASRIGTRGRKVWRARQICSTPPSASRPLCSRTCVANG